MDRYQKVEKPRPEEPIHENEIRITSQGLVRNYISYATALLQEKQGREIVLKGMGQAISKTVAITEILKRRSPWLHQVTAISSVSITDVWEPIEEGLLPVEQTRKVSMISITLSTKELNKNSPGYQAPSNVEQPKQYNNYQQQRQPLRQPRAQYNAVIDYSYGRGRGRGRARGGRGWNRGGYGNYQENDGYSNWSRGGYGDYQENAGYSNSSRGGYGNYQENAGYSNSSQGGYGNYQGNAGYSNSSRGGYRNYQENAGYSNSSRGGGRGRGWGNHGGGNERGRGGDGNERGRGGDGYERGRGYGRGRGRMGSRPRGGLNHQD